MVAECPCVLLGTVSISQGSRDVLWCPLPKQGGFLQDTTAVGETQGLFQGMSWSASKGTPRLSCPALGKGLHLPHAVGTVRHLSPAFLEPWDACLGRSAGSWAQLDSSPAEVCRESSLYQPVLFSHHLQTLQGVSVVSHKPLDLVALGRRMLGAAGNPAGGMHPGQGVLGLSALTSSLPTIFPRAQKPKI